MAASFVFNALEAAGLIVWMTTKQRLIPGRLLGRVSSLDWFISIGLVPVSFALTGPVAAAFGVRATLVGAGLLGAAITFALPVPAGDAGRRAGARRGRTAPKRGAVPPPPGPTRRIDRGGPSRSPLSSGISVSPDGVPYVRPSGFPIPKR